LPGQGGEKIQRLTSPPSQVHARIYSSPLLIHLLDLFIEVFVYIHPARIAIAINTYHQQEKHSDRKHITFSQFEGSIVEEAASMDRASNRAYEEFDPSVAWSRGAEADSVKIVLPGKRARD
jgi:hypothetical protein